MISLPLIESEIKLMKKSLDENDPVKKKIEDLIQKKADENAALKKLLFELDRSGSKPKDNVVKNKN